jgi:xanthine dehydrogenase large subunit
MDAPPPERPAKGEVREGVHVARRHDSADKHVAGTAAYADDVPEPRDLLHCHIATSEKARARIGPVDLSAVRAAPGVVWVGTSDDVPGLNDTGPVVHDEPMLAASARENGEVHFAGQALFVVAAESLAEARAAAALVTYQYAEEPPVLTVEQAMASGALLQPPYRIARGDARVCLEGETNLL